MRSSTSTTTTTPATFREPHPIRGILWGFITGLGATVVAILLKIIPLELVWVVLVMAAAVLLGVLWSTVGPARKPKGDPPWRHDEVVHRPDWDAAEFPESRRRWRDGSTPQTGPIPPDGPILPDVEPLHIQPLDLDPLDLDPPTAPVDTVDTASETVDTGSEAMPEPVFDPPRTMDPPPRSEEPPPPMLPPPRPA